MKKIFTYLSVIIVFAFTACGDDDSDNNDLPSPSKRLSKVEVYDDNGDMTEVETFTYDSQGRWIKSERELKRWDSVDPNYRPAKRIRTLTYSGNKILYSDSSREYDEIFATSNNKIQSRFTEGHEDGANIYQYSSDGYLVKIGEDYAHFEYTNGNLTKSKADRNYTFTYTNIPDRLGVSIFESVFNDEELDVYHDNPLYQLGYLGKRSNNLIESMKSLYSSLDNYSCSYTLDKEGYVAEMEKRREYGGYETYKFYYEE